MRKAGCICASPPPELFSTGLSEHARLHSSATTIAALSKKRCFCNYLCQTLQEFVASYTGGTLWGTSGAVLVPEAL